MDGQALTGVLIEHRQALQPPSIGGLIVDKVIAPDMMRIRRPRWGGRARAPRTPFRLFLDDLAPLVLPDATSGLAIHPPLCSLEQVVELPVAQAWIPLRERMNTRDHLGGVPLA